MDSAEKSSPESEKLPEGPLKSPEGDIKEKREAFSDAVKIEAKKELTEFIETDDELAAKEQEAGIENPDSKNSVNQERADLQNEAKSTWDNLSQAIDKTEEKYPVSSVTEKVEGETKAKEEEKIGETPIISEPITEENADNTDKKAETEAVENESVGEAEVESEEEVDLENLTEKQAEEANDTLRKVEEILFGQEAQTEEERQMAEEYMNTGDEEREKIIADTRAKYAAELGLQDGYDADMLLKKQEELEAKLGKTELADGLKFQEEEFVKIIEKGEELLAEGNPEKIKAYLESMADNIDDCSKRLKYIFLQMEKNPEAKKALQEEYLTLTTAIQKFEDASKILRNLMDMVDKAGQEGRNLSPAEKEELYGFLRKFGKIILLLGVVAGLIYGIAKFAASHPIASIGTGGTVAGLYKLGVIGAHGVSATAFADLLFKAAFLKIMIFDEEKRDKAVGLICDWKLPAWALKPAKKKPEEKK